MTAPNHSHEQPQNELQQLRDTIAALEARLHSSLAHPWLDDVNDAVIVLDASRRIQEWNRAAEQIYGFARAEAAGQSIRSLIPVVRFVGAEPSGDPWDEIQRQGIWRKTFVQLRRDGREIEVEFIDFIRSDRRFRSAEELVVQMEADIVQAKAVLSAN